MCGFLGYTSQKEKVTNLAPQLQAGLASLTHRGPDSGDELIAENVYLGHRRLSIIDLKESSNQPLQNSDGDVILIYNGEIYNYKELSQKYALHTTHSDTHTLLQGYCKKGPEILNELRGIYAFALLHLRKEPVIILVRDPSGIKPLYYFKKNKTFTFASEIKAIKPLVSNSLSMNETSLLKYLSLSYTVEPETAWNEISSLEPGSFLTYNIKNDNTDTRKFFNYLFAPTSLMSKEELLSQTETTLKNAVERNMVADTDIAISLSGGIDSTLIYAMANGISPVKGYTVTAGDKEHDETLVAARCAQHVSGPP